MEYVLQTHLLTKQYGNKIVVDHVDMNIHKGDIYGFIGRNGAGKTTIMKMISDLARPNSGTIKLFEMENLQEERKRCGTIIEQPALYPNMTASQNLTYYSKILGITDKNAINDLLVVVGLESAGKKKTKQFSLGMKQRLSIAIALMGNPDFLILDEPMNGLDPTGIKEMRELLLKLNKEKEITILISSHILGELYKIANHYGVIEEGRMIDEFTKEELDTRCTSYLEIKVADAKAAAYILETELGISKYEILPDNTIYLYGDHLELGKINQVLVKKDIYVESITMQEEDLEGYFLKLMGGKKNA